MKTKIITTIETPIGTIKKIEPVKNQLSLIKNVSKQYKKRKTFNLCFYDFDKTLEDGINSFTKNKKYRNNLNNNDINCLNIIKKIANKNIANITNIDRKKYLYSLENLCFDFKEEINNKYISGFVVPASGGNIIARFLKIKKSKIIPINCKRVQLKEKNKLGLGMNIDLLKEYKNSKVKKWYFNKLKFLDNKDIVFLEVSVASGLTTISFLLELITNKIKPKKIKLLTPFSSIKGLENIKKFSKYYNFDLEIKSKIYLENLGDYWSGVEDSILDEKNMFVIGNATKILNCK